ncbi:hypothetical protein EUGRSUZ_J02597 [Eucalyptus grandis]|uniref:Uncharacterized protein n=2 Tax=Eucalyptus grandis TaxID=71139 RepID=A0ACC3JAX5_EUCGR|nr:hypothetical protein EUGRSUZ_J02597 [Eucalyptus grandis]
MISASLKTIRDCLDKADPFRSIVIRKNIRTVLKSPSPSFVAVCSPQNLSAESRALVNPSMKEGAVVLYHELIVSNDEYSPRSTSHTVCTWFFKDDRVRTAVTLLTGIRLRMNIATEPTRLVIWLESHRIIRGEVEHVAAIDLVKRLLKKGDDETVILTLNE